MADERDDARKPNCETNGHVYGPQSKCVFCGTPRVLQPMPRPTGSNADEWAVFLEYWCAPKPSNLSFVAVQIAEAIDDAGKRKGSKGVKHG